MSKRLEEATRLVQKWNSSIMLVQHGCRVINKSLFTRTIEKIGYSYLIGDAVYSCSQIESQFEILGREINLEDILQASRNIGKHVTIDSIGTIEYIIGGLELCSWYDLEKPFTNQSQEFYEFLIKILS